jgi:hypothetical protein
MIPLSRIFSSLFSPLNIDELRLLIIISQIVSNLVLFSSLKICDFSPTILDMEKTAGRLTRGIPFYFSWNFHCECDTDT